MQAREIQLLADVAEERQMNRNLQYQLQGFKNTLEVIKKMVCRGMHSRIASSLVSQIEL